MTQYSFLTEQDEQNFGRDLLDVAQRSALQAAAPYLQNLEQQTIELQRRLAMEARRNLDQRVEAVVPDYRERDQDPRFHEYLREIDPLSGRPRQVLLNDAIASGDAARIANFFYGYDGSASARQGSGQGAPRASSPRARSHPSTSAGPSGQPVFTRPEIAALYAAHRRGAYKGREEEWARIEQSIIEAARTGNINSPPYLTK
jgi:hypothetical protein